MPLTPARRQTLKPNFPAPEVGAKFHGGQSKQHTRGSNCRGRSDCRGIDFYALNPVSALKILFTLLRVTFLFSFSLHFKSVIGHFSSPIPGSILQVCLPQCISPSIAAQEWKTSLKSSTRSTDSQPCLLKVFKWPLD